MSNRFCNETPLSLSSQGFLAFFRISSSLLIEARSSIDRSIGLLRLRGIGAYGKTAEEEEGGFGEALLCELFDRGNKDSRLARSSFHSYLIGRW